MLIKQVNAGLRVLQVEFRAARRFRSPVLYLRLAARAGLLLFLAAFKWTIPLIVLFLARQWQAF